jgi:hypothetical protein
MIGMRLGTGLFLPINIKTEIFPTPVAELKEVPVQGRTTNFAMMDLHFKFLMV